MTTLTGSTYDNMDYQPFGEQIAGSSGTTHKFEGKERDAETNNDDFGARYYSSSLGRWLSADWSSIPALVPYANLTNRQTLNLYSMVSDNPESFADLDDHEAGCPADKIMGPGSGQCQTPPSNGNHDPQLSPCQKDNEGDCANKTNTGAKTTPDQSQSNQAQQQSAEVPQAVKGAIMASLNASNAPSGADKTGGFHEESGVAGTDVNGKLVISPDKPGPYANPDTTSEAHTSGQPVDQNVRNSIANVTVGWHIHPSGTTATHNWNQPPSAADRAGAIPGAINIVVGARNKTVYFYGPSGPVVHIKLKDFMGGP